MDISFENKRILVTGGCQGIGKEICLRVLKRKGIVIALSNNRENLEKLSKENPKIQTVCVELLDWEATRAAVKSVLPIDMLVNNAGVALLSPCLSATPRDFDITYGINVKAMLNVSQVVGQSLIERKVPGSIVNISSLTSLGAIQDAVIYGSSKAAVNMLTKTMALELGPHKIRVNCVQPILVLTELGEIFCKNNPKVVADVKNRIPLGRFAEVNDIAEAVIFLLSDNSSMINGIGLPVDGGFIAA